MQAIPFTGLTYVCAILNVRPRAQTLRRLQLRSRQHLRSCWPDGSAQWLGWCPFPPKVSSSYLSLVEHLQRHLLSENWARVSRVQRTVVGRSNLTESDSEANHADICVAVHACGASVWEVLLFGLPQPFDIAKWLNWLDLDSTSSPARALWGASRRHRGGALIQLRREIFDNLEEYHSTLAKTHSYTEESIARGEVSFGIDDLFKIVTDRLKALTFEITTRNQRSVNRSGLWLTTSFGAIETGFVAAASPRFSGGR